MYCISEANIDEFIKNFAKNNNATVDNVKFIEKYLEFQDEDNCKEDIVRASALRVLCSKYYWGLTENYLEYIKRIIETNDWRYSETVIVSFSVLAEYLYDSPSVCIFEFLVSLLKNELNKYAYNQDVEILNRIKSIYICIFEALNGETSSIGLLSSGIRIPEDTNTLITTVNNKTRTLKM